MVAGTIDMVVPATAFIAGSVYFMVNPETALGLLSTSLKVLPSWIDGSALGVSAILAWYTFRDCTAQGRSLGKRLCKLEIVQLAETERLGVTRMVPTAIPATRGMALVRNAYGLIGAVPFFSPVFMALTNMDTTLILFSKHRRSVSVASPPLQKYSGEGIVVTNGPWVCAFGNKRRTSSGMGICALCMRVVSRVAPLCAHAVKMLWCE